MKLVADAVFSWKTSARSKRRDVLQEQSLNFCNDRLHTLSKKHEDAAVSHFGERLGPVNLIDEFSVAGLRFYLIVHGKGQDAR